MILSQDLRIGPVALEKGSYAAFKKMEGGKL